MTGTKTVYLITGANRGIGLCLVQLLLARPQTVVVGTVRSDAAKAQLHSGTSSVVCGEGSVLVGILLDYSSGLEADVVEKTVTAALEAEAGVKYLDVLVANAGHTMEMGDVLATTPAQMRELYEINTIGPLVTFQGLWKLMQQRGAGAGNGKAKYVLISSSVGSMGMMEPMPGGAYGPSKAAANWIAKAVHLQYGQGKGDGGRGVVGVAVHPGWVKTGMGEKAARSWGVPEGHGPNVTAEDSAKSVLDLVDKAEEFGGKFVMEGGKELLW